MIVNGSHWRQGCGSGMAWSRYPEHFLWNCLQVNTTWPHLWSHIIGSDNGLVSSDDKPLPDSMLTQLHIPTQHHQDHVLTKTVFTGMGISFIRISSHDVPSYFYKGNSYTCKTAFYIVLQRIPLTIMSYQLDIYMQIPRIRLIHVSIGCSRQDLGNNGWLAKFLTRMPTEYWTREHHIIFGPFVLSC